MLNSQMHTHKERGATAVLIAASLILLLGMAAIAVDYGAGLNERRQDQTGADLAALGGTLELMLGSTTQQAVTEIVRLVDVNVRTTPLADWTACTDADALPVTASDIGLTPATQCISFDTFFKVRVRVPNQQVSTTFARIIGTTSLTASAAAETLGQPFGGLGKPPPFAVLAGFSGGDLVCLRTNSSGNPPTMTEGNGPGNDPSRGTEPDPCDDSVYPADSEAFGLLDPYAYFDSDGTIACKKNVNDYFIAAGIDHTLSSYAPTGYTPGDPEKEEGEGCTGNPKNPINGANTIPVKSGLSAQELRCGMLTSRSGNCDDDVPGPPATTLASLARLHQGSYVQSTYQFLGEDMDNKALWEFFTKDPDTDAVTFTNAPSSCQDFADAINNDFTNPTDWDYYDKRDALLDCLTDWNPANHSQLFENDIWLSPRFSFVPLLYEETFDKQNPPPPGVKQPATCPWSGDPKCVHIDDFVPIWIQTLYTQSPDSNCDDSVPTGPNKWGMHHAGQENSCGDSNGNLDRLNAIVIDCGMLSEAVCKARPGPPGTTPGGDLIPEIVLTK